MKAQMLPDNKVIGLSGGGDSIALRQNNNRDMSACLVEVVQQLSTHNPFLRLKVIIKPNKKTNLLLSSFVFLKCLSYIKKGQ